MQDLHRRKLILVLGEIYVQTLLCLNSGKKRNKKLRNIFLNFREKNRNVLNWNM